MASRRVKPLFTEDQADVVRLRRLLGLIEDAAADLPPEPDIPVIPVARPPGPTFAEMWAFLQEREERRRKRATRTTAILIEKPESGSAARGGW